MTKSVDHLAIGSEEWLQWRKSKITATDAPVILGLSTYCNPTKLWAEKLNLIDKPQANVYMQRGNELEPKAREAFEEMTGLIFFPCIIEHKIIPWMAASLDGMSLEEDVIVEIKCNGPKSHTLALEGKIPPHHHAQMQHQIEVTGLELAYYFSYDGEEGVIIEVERDKDFLEKMIEKEQNFWDLLQTFTPPPLRKSQEI